MNTATRAKLPIPGIRCAEVGKRLNEVVVMDSGAAADVALNTRQQDSIF